VEKTSGRSENLGQGSRCSKFCRSLSKERRKKLGLRFRVKGGKGRGKVFDRLADENGDYGVKMGGEPGISK